MKRLVKWMTSFTGDDQMAVLQFVGNMLQQRGLIGDAAEIQQEFLQREEKGNTILSDNLAIPHTQSPLVNEAALLYLRLPLPVVWDATQEVSRFVFILLPEKAAKSDLLAMKDFFIQLADDHVMTFLASGTRQEVSKIINGELD